MADEHRLNEIVSEFVVCASCQGVGLISKVPCRACDGKGNVEVVKPAIPCPRCNGTGKHKPASPVHGPESCIVCQGTGWALRLSSSADESSSL